jgi:hypothetical protein
VLLPPNISQQIRCQCWRISASYILLHTTKTKTGFKLKLVHSEMLGFQTFNQLATLAGTETTPNLKRISELLRYIYMGESLSGVSSIDTADNSVFD